MPKTDTGFRTVPLSHENVALLRALKKKRLAEALNDNGIVFCSVKGTRIHPRNFNRDLASICEKAGINKISANVTRHTFASTALRSRGRVQDGLRDFRSQRCNNNSTITFTLPKTRSKKLRN